MVALAPIDDEFDVSHTKKETMCFKQISTDSADRIRHLLIDNCSNCYQWSEKWSSLTVFGQLQSGELCSITVDNQPWKYGPKSPAVLITRYRRK